MTLSTDIYLPLPKDYEGKMNTDNYLNDLVFDLQDMYQNLAQNINGTFSNTADTFVTPWSPLLSGSTTPGVFTYVNQVGLTWRQGIMTEVWGDVSWSSTTATGNLCLTLPYICSKSNGMPFVGDCQSSAITYTVGTSIYINAIPNTLRAEFWNSGTGISTQNQQVVASGRVIFHVRYIGVSDG